MNTAQTTLIFPQIYFIFSFSFLFNDAEYDQNIHKGVLSYKKLSKMYFKVWWLSYAMLRYVNVFRSVLVNILEMPTDMFPHL